MKPVASILVQSTSIIVGLVIAVAGGGGLIWLAYQSCLYYPSPGVTEYHLINAIRPIIGAILVFALAAFVGAPERFYKKPPIRIIAFILGSLLALGCIGSAFTSIAFFQWSQGGENVGGYDVIAGAIALLAFAAAVMLFVKALKVRKIPG